MNPYLIPIVMVKKKCSLIFNRMVFDFKKTPILFFRLNLKK